MPSYHYLALNQEHKELSGIIEAPDETGARSKLNMLGLSVVSLEVTAEAQVAAPTSSDQTTFEFEALDKNAKKVTGTIVAENLVKAYARLFDEYQLNVLSILAPNATEQEKAAAHTEGIRAIQDEYRRLYGTKKKEAVLQEKEQSYEQEKERKDLFDIVEFTTHRIEKFLQMYSQDLKIEERDALQAYINQLLRIKDSTNLEHIRSTCERMLAHIQNQELFIHEEQKLKESAQLKVETKELLTQLKRRGLSQNIDVVKTLRDIKESSFLRPVANYLLKLFTSDNPEVQKLEEEVAATNTHIWSYFKMLIGSRVKNVRSEAWASIKTLYEEKKRLKMKIKALKEQLRVTEHGEKAPSIFLEHAQYTVGWVLAFYFAAYLVSYPFTIKQLPLAKIPAGFFFYHTSITKVLTIFLFMTYSTLVIHNFWLRDKEKLPYLLYPVTLLSFLLIVVNLM